MRATPFVPSASASALLALLLAACQPAPSPVSPSASAPVAAPASVPAPAASPAASASIGFVPPAAADSSAASAARAERPSAKTESPAKAELPAPAASAAPQAAAAQRERPDEAVIGALSFVGGMHALGMHCGRLSTLQQETERERIRKEWVASGKISAANFDAMYRVILDGTAKRIQANPQQAQQGCAQYEAMQAQGLKAAQALGLSKP